MRNITIRNNRIYNCKTGYSEAVTVQGNVEGFVVSRNVIHDNTNIGIDIAGFYNNDCSDPKLNQARKGVVSGNLIYNLYCAYATCAGIYVDGGRDTIIENNTIYNTMYGIEIGCENAVDKVHTAYQATVSGIVVRNNLVYNNTKAGLTNGGYEGLETGKVIGTKIYGNTFYNNVVEIELSYCDDIMIEKNIIDNSGNSRYFIYSDMPGLATRIRLDDNLYFRQDGSSKFKFNGQYAASLSEWQSKFSQDTGSRYADPMFANPADGDFTLLDQSPAIGFIR
jgi:hypothetical protein